IFSAKAREEASNYLRQHLHFAISDLEKILKYFNSAIQAQKLIVINETEISSGE
ncbi:16423_t:CDS:2, partial [Funneliformis geosporum]